MHQMAGTAAALIRHVQAPLVMNSVILKQETTMENISIFFANEQNILVLKKFKAQVDAIFTEDHFEISRNSHIKTILSGMLYEPQIWDKMCGININWIGDQFISNISNVQEELTKDKLDDIFSICFRFLFEFYLSIKNDLSMEFEKARRFAFENLDSFTIKAKDQIEYSVREMPITIFKSIYNNEDIESIKDFNKVSLDAKAKKEEWDKELNEREDRVKTLKDELSKYEIGFNFVGLFQGFDELSKDKVDEKENLAFWLKTMGIVILLPLIAEIIFMYFHFDFAEINKMLLVFTIIPTVSIVIILIYYFRVILHNYNATKSELLQIELRKTLCRFIQHYSDYAKKMKSSDKDSLEKFENIIFSGIISNSEKLPSTYDGLNSLVNALKTFKKQ